jgi:hypothetical protein
LYEWLWHRLPGGPGSKVFSLMLIVALVVALLWYFVFPWAALHLPIDRVGVTG